MLLLLIPFKCHLPIFCFSLQINTAVQQPGFRRVKRGLRPQVPGIHGLHYSATLGESNSIDVEPTDPYFPMQWYLKNTGQNGGKVRLDLNVQAAWAQGITGKNVTTAIMDDGRCNQRQSVGNSNHSMFSLSSSLLLSLHPLCVGCAGRRGLHASRLEIQLCE